MDVDEARQIKGGGALQLTIEEAIENAAVHNDGEVPTVTVTVTAVGDRARIGVADDGPGIPEAEWDVVASGEETPLVHGSGIGLWLIHWIVTILGGTVEHAENEPRGSIVTLEVPLVSEATDARPRDEQ